MISLTRVTENNEELDELKKEMQQHKREESEKAFTLAPLPYPETGLEPHLSPHQINAHYREHHKGYVDGANGILEKLANLRKNNEKGDVKSLLKTLSFHVAMRVFYVK